MKKIKIIICSIFLTCIAAALFGGAGTAAAAAAKPANTDKATLYMFSSPG